MKRLLLTLAVLLGMATTMAAVGEEQPAEEKARLEAKIEELTQRLNQMQHELVELQKESRPATVTRVYNMENLLLPTSADSSGLRIAVTDQKRLDSALESWVELIQVRISPSSWKERGIGEGTIAHFSTNMSLVINQSEAVHAELASFFKEIRQAKQQLELLDVAVQLTPQPKWKFAR